MDFLIGLDIGTTKLCAVALGIGNGKLLASVQARNKAGIPAGPDAAEQDAGVLVADAIELLRKLTRRAELAEGHPVALGVTGQMHGLVLVNDTGKPLTPLIGWQDGRGHWSCKSTGRSYVEEFTHRLGQQALESGGCLPASGYGGVSLLCLAEEGKIPDKAVALTIHDYVVCRLCGRAVMDPTDAASWGIFDVRDGNRWISGIADILRIRTSLLPEVLPTGSKAGELLSGMADATGLPAGLPVAVALGDNQASFIGSVPRLSETLLMNLGTGGQMSVPISVFTRVAGLDTRPLISERWLLVGASLCGGRAYEVLEHFFRSMGREIFPEKEIPPLYEIMNRLAADAAVDCDGMRVRPLFAGSRQDPLAQGSVEGVTVTNLTPPNLTRAVVRGMVEELSGFYERARAAGARPSILAGAGNAVRHNPVVRQELERQLRMPLRLSPHAEEAAVGAALAGGVASGVYRDWESAGNDLFH